MTGRLGGLRAKLAVIGLDEPLADLAGELAVDHALRGYDAVHLATALSLREAVMVSWDADLNRAALRSGLAVAGD